MEMNQYSDFEIHCEHYEFLLEGKDKHGLRNITKNVDTQKSCVYTASPLRGYCVPCEGNCKIHYILLLYIGSLINKCMIFQVNAINVMIIY